MNLPPTFHKNHRLAHLKWEKTRPSDSDSEVGKFSHASKTRARGASRLRNNVSVPGAHKGIDFMSVDGQEIISPINAEVRNFIGYTSGKPMLQLRPINSNLNFDTIEILYVNPPKGVDFSGVWRNVSAGDVIGNSVNLQSLGYGPKVGPHVYLQLWKNGVRINPYKFFFK